MNVEGKVVIITGASSGIGLATARLFAEKRSQLALVSRSLETLSKLAKELPRSIAIRADMADETAAAAMVRRTLDHFGTVDILINNAGQGYDASIEKTDLTKFRYLFDLHVIGVLVAMQSVIPIMREQGGGMIVNVSSGASLMTLPNNGPYSATKRALNGLSLTARKELAKDNIRVSVVYPYMTLSDFEKNTELFSSKEAQLPRAADRSGLAPQDSANYVAEKILEVIEDEKPEQFAHDWMSRLLEEKA